MFAKLKSFILDDAGAVTVDWVVLTASIVALNVVVVLNFIETGIDVQMQFVDDKLDEAISQ